MLRIRKVADATTAVNRSAIEAAQKIMREQFPAMPDYDIAKLPEQLAREELRRGNATPFTRRGRPSKAWIKYVPRTARDAHRPVRHERAHHGIAPAL